MEQEFKVGDWVKLVNGTRSYLMGRVIEVHPEWPADEVLVQ